MHKHVCLEEKNSNKKESQGSMSSRKLMKRKPYQLFLFYFLGLLGITFHKIIRYFSEENEVIREKQLQNHIYIYIHIYDIYIYMCACTYIYIYIYI